MTIFGKYKILMNTITRFFFEKPDVRFFFKRDISAVFRGSEYAKQALLKRAIAAGDIVRIRRGFYCLNSNLQRTPINELALAQLVYGPSYISMETALRFYNWIPEAVYSITSVSINKAKDFITPLGLYNYKRVPQNIFYSGVERIIDDYGNVILIASPLKALCDYIYTQKVSWKALKPLIDNLRVEYEDLRKITTKEFLQLENTYRSQRVNIFIKSLKKELHL
jgi:predicted transcriptional regulator of viral defense system